MKRIILAILVSLVALPAAAAYKSDAAWNGNTRLDGDHGKLECEFKYVYHGPYNQNENRTFWSTSMEHGKSPVCPVHLTYGDDSNWHVGDLGWDAWNNWKNTNDYQQYKLFLSKEKNASNAPEGEYTWILTEQNGDMVRVLNEDFHDYRTRIRTNTAESHKDFLYAYADKPIISKDDVLLYGPSAEDHYWWSLTRYQHIPGTVNIDMSKHHYDSVLYGEDW